MGQGDTLVNGVVGALFAFVFQFVPLVGFLAPFAGGWLAGHLQQESGGGGLKAGLSSGLVLLIPNGVAAVLIVLLFTLFGGLSGDPEALLGGFLFGALSGAALFVVVALYILVLAVLGGVVGGALVGTGD